MPENPKIFNSGEGIIDIGSVNLDEDKTLGRSADAANALKKSIKPISMKSENDLKKSSSPFSKDGSEKSLVEQMRGEEKEEDFVISSRKMGLLDDPYTLKL